jgi:hydrophobic/amphiphilic exporter-1 (mainly G- bacteria), HAE1 family
MSDISTHSEHKNNADQGRNFNYYIKKFFLKNTRLTVLSFVLLIIVGAITTFNAKTTGFPNPEIGISVVQTVYPGASSDTVAKDVSLPLEGAIKGVEGVKTYTSFSRDSFSIISVTLDESSNFDSVRNKLDSAVKSVSLPTGAETPKVIKPEIGGPSLVYSVAGDDLAKVYDIYSKAVSDLNQLPETSSVTPIVDLKKQAVIKLDLSKVNAANLTVDQIERQIKSIGESIPVISDTNLDQKNYSIVTSVQGSSLKDIQNLQFSPARIQAAQTEVSNNPPRSIKLSDISETTIEYKFDTGNKTNIALRKDDKSKISQAVVFDVRAAKGTDLATYTKIVNEKFKGYDNTEFIIGNNISQIPDNKIILAENFSENDQNQEQVNEVISGLIGGKLSFIDGDAANIGWLLGGIQLVFLVMLAFVSWRAAIIAAISIPLSLVFSTIYLSLIGETLNTLVLFSLVLVIGLVVDPALVILEAIQRKVDTGLKGNEAVLEAVKDVGNGLFLATLTNIIVFLPFGVISGLLGQIFSYIPLTVIPATIGSYIVPLVFLSWIGGLILKPTKNKTEDEEKNLWGIAKWIINLNQKILDGSRAIRFLIILLALILPLGLVGYYFSSGEIKSAQFASTDNNTELSISGSFLPEVTKIDRENSIKELMEIAIANENVLQVYPDSSSSTPGNVSLSIIVKNAADRDIKSSEIAKEINTKIINKFVENTKSPKFFDINTDVAQTGPPTSAYQVSVSVKTDDLQKLESASLAVGNKLKEICFTSSREVTITTDCNGERIVNKVDDGYTNKQSKVVEVILDRQKLQQAQLTVPNAPLSILVNQSLRQLFNINDAKSLVNINENGDNLEVVLDKNSDDPKTLEEIKNTVITSLSGQSVKLADVSQIIEKTPKSSIQRVKGQTIGVIQAGLKEGYTDQTTSALISTAITNYYQDEAKTNALGLEKGSVGEYSEGNTAANNKSFTELLIALVLAIFLTYVALALFFQSFTQPLVVLYTIPLTFLGVFPALNYLGTGEIGFLEIIGLIILIGIVENVAIFLIDSARQKISFDGWEEKRAISFASGVRFKPVLLTTFTAVASLAPLAILSQFYRSIALVIMFGLITSGFQSLVTTPILFVFFRWLSRQYHGLKWFNKVLFFPLFPIFIIGMAIMDRPKKPVKVIYEPSKK